MKSLLLSFLIALSAFALRAQTVTLDWSNSIGGTALDRGTSIAVDDANNTYTTGYFRYTADFDPGAGITTLTANSFAAFVCKFSPAGGLIWAKAFQTTSQSYGHAITVDHNNNVLVTGYFSGTIDLDPGTDSLNVASTGFNDAFICKLDSAGNLVWGKTFAGTEEQKSYAIGTDNAGNVYTVGNFSGTADFNPNAAAYNLTATSSSDIYISKLKANGSFSWAKRIGVGGSTGLTYGFSKFYGIALDASGHSYVTGHFAGATDFGTDTVTAVNDWDIFICKLDSNGNYNWVKQMGSSGTDVGMGITTDNNGFFYTCGGFSQTVDFDLGTATHNLTANGGNEDVYIAKYSSAANLIWVKQIGGAGIDVGYGITTDYVGGVYTVGLFSGAMDFNPDAGVKTLGTTGDDVFVERLDNPGTFSLAYVMGSPAINPDEGLGVTVDANANIYTTGHYSGDMDFDPDTATINQYTSNGNEDIFVHKMSQCLAAFHTVTPTACFSYSLNGQDYSASGTYTQVFNNASGCDSILIINLTIDTVDVSLYLTGSIISTNATGATFQWLDCDSTVTPLAGETGYQLYPTANGSYSVIITQNGCPDTSACTAVNNVGIEDVLSENNFALYPNPANDAITINYHLPIGTQNAQAEILSVTGVIIQKINLKVQAPNQLLHLNKLSSGIYLCRIIADGKSVNQKRLVVIH